MHFPTYWAKGTASALDREGSEFEREVWRWSDVSAEDAATQARAYASLLAERAAAGQERQGERGGYGYPNRPLREPILTEIPLGADGRAIITRNSFGCEILNTDTVLFVDVDFPEVSSSTPIRASNSGGFFASLFGKKPVPPTTPTPIPSVTGPQDRALDQLERWCASNPESAFRVYLTPAGLRYLCLTHLHDPMAPETDALFAALGADPLYARLCRAQKSFRARITPKPWRCKFYGPPERFPYRHEANLSKWLEKYRAVSAEYAACRYLKTIGSGAPHPAAGRVAAEHDIRSQADSTLPMA